MSKKIVLLLSALLLTMLCDSVVTTAQHVAPAPPVAPRASIAPPAQEVSTAALAPPAPVQATAAPSVPLAPLAAAIAQTPEAPEAPAVSMFFSGDNFLGVYTEEVTTQNMSRFNLREARGVGVSRVVKDSPAERAGLRENDVIIRFDGETVSSIRKLNRLIDESAPEHSARLTILRSGAEQELTVKLGRRRGFEGGVLRGQVLSPKESEELRAQTEQMRRQGEQLRKQLEEMGRDNPGVFSMSFGGGRRIGVSTTPLTAQLAEFFGVERGRGVLISSVSENSPAARAGLKAGDVVTEVDGERVEGSGNLSRAINRRKEGDITLTIIRERRSRTVRLVPEQVKAPEFEMFTETPTVALAPRARITLPRISLPRIDVPMPRVRITPQNLRRLNLRGGTTLL
ncbi:MAG TPA: PDZ domain-containing protein [Pyrinomonadaceae bacterium]|jgi:serine protease Do